MSNEKRNILIVIFFALCIGLLFYFLSKANNDNYLPEQKTVEEGCIYNLASRIKGANSSTLISIFPTKSYLDSGNYINIECLLSELNDIDNITKDPSMSQQIMSTILTDSLLKRDSINYKTYNPDKYIYLMQSIEKYQYYAEIDSKHKIFFMAIYDFWMNFISDKLTNFSKEEPSIKYGFKYKFLVAKCSERKYNIGVKVTATEKVIDNLVRSKWGHLFDASWNQTTLIKKLIFVFIFLVFFYGIYCIIHKHFLR